MGLTGSLASLSAGPGGGELQLTAPRVITRAATGPNSAKHALPAVRREGGHPEEDPRRPERARARGRRCPRRGRPGVRSERTCAAGPKQESARTLARRMAGEALFSGRETCGASFAPRGEQRRKKLSGLRGEREDRELGKAARLRPQEERGRGGAWCGGGGQRYKTHPEPVASLF